eukprot:1048345-Rhodomonas_salina.2
MSVRSDSCNTLTWVLLQNGYTHGAVTSMIEDAARVAEDQLPSPRSNEPIQTRVTAAAFARILASFHANKRAQTDNTHK